MDDDIGGNPDAGFPIESGADIQHKPDYTLRRDNTTPVPPPRKQKSGSGEEVAEEHRVHKNIETTDELIGYFK